ncbi:hypothetical protein PT974_01950 [Cladobotryum mycophilum]|uniref:Uncharacterized protein n=1 Tax=Cladobotryum mycophilum TaxID=491253 RepID=A0ABR0SWS5_9HYPO
MTMDFAPYQSSPRTRPRRLPHNLPPRLRRPILLPHHILRRRRRRAQPPPLQHPQPQRAWSSGDLDGQVNGGGFGLGGWSFSGFAGGMISRGGSASMPGAYPAEVSEFDTSLGLRLDYEACLAYLVFPPIGAMILLILEKNSDYVRFHAWQSALLFTAIMVFHLLFSWSSFLSWIFFFGDIALIGFLTLKAYRDAEILDRFEVPFFGRIASRILDDE